MVSAFLSYLPKGLCHKLRRKIENFDSNLKNRFNKNCSRYFIDSTINRLKSASFPPELTSTETCPVCTKDFLLSSLEKDDPVKVAYLSWDCVKKKKKKKRIVIKWTDLTVVNLLFLSRYMRKILFFLFYLYQFKVEILTYYILSQTGMKHSLNGVLFQHPSLEFMGKKFFMKILSMYFQCKRTERNLKRAIL